MQPLISNKECLVPERQLPQRLFNADSTDSNLFARPFIDLTVTSPPYNVGMPYESGDESLNYPEYLDFTKKWLSNVYDWTKDSGRLCLNIPLDKNKGGQQSVGADITTLAKQVGWKYQSTIIWNEQNMSRRTAWGSWLSASAPYVIAPVELILVLFKNSWKKLEKGQSDVTKDEFLAWTNGVWNFNGESAKRIGHPAPFPKELPYRCIKLFSYVGTLVFDPFAGSGTTAIVAEQLKRGYCAVELDKEYFLRAKKRITQSKTRL